MSSQPLASLLFPCSLNLYVRQILHFRLRALKKLPPLFCTLFCLRPFLFFPSLEYCFWDLRYFKRLYGKCMCRCSEATAWPVHKGTAILVTHCERRNTSISELKRPCLLNLRAFMKNSHKLQAATSIKAGNFPLCFFFFLSSFLFPWHTKSPVTSSAKELADN